MISYEKVRKTWWKAVVDGDPEIDATAVDSTARWTSTTARRGRDPRTRSDQQQKMRGLPTSDEIGQEEILDKARYLPGSPFLPPEERTPAAPTRAERRHPRLPARAAAPGDESACVGEFARRGAAAGRRLRGHRGAPCQPACDKRPAYPKAACVSGSPSPTSPPSPRVSLSRVCRVRLVTIPAVTETHTFVLET